MHFKGLKFIGYSKSIFPSTHIGVNPMLSETYLYVKGREYTLEVPNNNIGGIVIEQD